MAYNNEILSYSAPETIETTEKRKRLKDQISSITYSGDTDIGLGVSHACELFSEKKNTRRIMVLISDGKQTCRQEVRAQKRSPVRNWIIV